MYMYMDGIKIMDDNSTVTDSHSILKRWGASKSKSDMSESRVNQVSSTNTLRQTNLLFIRLDLISMLLTQYSDLR